MAAFSVQRRVSSDGLDGRPELRPIFAQLAQALAPSIRILKLMGEGGMGLVFLGRDETLKREVAIKVLSPAVADDPVARARFRREAEAAAAVSHPNIVAVYQVGELPESNIPYIVMQLVDGPTLADATGRVLPEARVRRVMSEVASALAAAHRRTLVHRDVKPANIILDGETGRALVLDFGITAALSSRRKSVGSRLTSEGVYLGTPTYMSPEQASGDEITAKSDVYSLGVVIYELLVGQPPFRGPNATAVMAMQVKDAPPRLVERRPDLSAELVALIERCMAKDPDRRPRAREIVDFLQHGGRRLVEWPPPGLARLQRRGARLTYALGGFAVLGAAFFAVLASHPAVSSMEAEAPWWGFVLSACVTALGLCTLLIGVRAGLFARLGLQARRAGYPWRVIRDVALDIRRDTGELLNGLGSYALLEDEERRRLLRLRRVQVACIAAAFVAATVTLYGWASGWLSGVPGGADALLPVPEALAAAAPILLCLAAFFVAAFPEAIARRRASEGGWLGRRTSGQVPQNLVEAWLAGAGETSATTSRHAPLRLAAGLVSAIAIVGALSAVIVLTVVADTTVDLLKSRRQAEELIMPHPAPAASALGALFADPSDRGMLRLFDDPAVAPERRIELLHHVVWGACFNAREVLFGMDGRRVAMLDSAAVRLRDVNGASDAVGPLRQRAVRAAASGGIIGPREPAGSSARDAQRARLLGALGLGPLRERVLACRG